MQCIKKLIYVKNSGGLNQNAVISAHSHCNQLRLETSSVTVFVTSSCHHFKLTLLSFQFAQKHHIHIYSAKIVLQNSYIISLIHQISGIFFDKSCLS